MLSVPTTGFAVADEAASEGRSTVRFFTPRTEIDACGHVTVAIATAFVELGIWSWRSEATIRASGGEVPLRLSNGSVEMRQQLQLLEPARLGWGRVGAALGSLDPHPDLPLAVSGTGLRHLIIPVVDVEALADVTVERHAVVGLASAAGVDTICVWAFSGSDRRVRVRDLCGAIGALEEPASGTTAGALALYLASHAEASGELVVEQGIEMGRPSRIDVAILGRDEAVVRGRARCVVSGTLEDMTGDLDVEAPPQSPAITGVSLSATRSRFAGSAVRGVEGPLSSDVAPSRNLLDTRVRRFYDELWNEWRLELADELLAPDVAFRGSLGAEVRGRAEFTAYALTVRAAFPDFHNHLLELVVDRNRAAARLQYSGTHRGPILGIAPTGKQITYQGAAFFSFDERLRIVRAWVLGDLVNLLRELGATKLPK